ncbi:3-hydroxy-3-methylglutaryl-CoA reductase, partial [Candidatus Bathyarchaeota archaeon]|nr:3-hydroxy-3-methylglutaryl-CoA reductase [Candidatus Bathyarchaeota archaeon]
MSEEFSSRISGFYRKPIDERIRIISEKVNLSKEETKILESGGGLSMDAADHMTENVVGTVAYPFSIAVNFRINGKDYLVPMVGEEPSVVAAASNMARLMREGEGITAKASDPIMIGQIQVLDIQDMEKAIEALEKNKKMLLESANELDPVLVKFGGGAKDLELRPIDTERGKMLIVHILVDCRDAMGANAVNTMAEALAPTIAELTGGRTLLRIISNLADKRTVTVKCRVKADDIGEEGAVDRIVDAWAFAEADPYRA